jgi:glycyl-tRNA synthetase
MEIEYFCRPEDSGRIYEEWVETRKKWYLDLGIKPQNIRFRRHSEDELAHYAKACTDVEYFFPWGWSELEGIANRADFDLKQHAEYSGRDLTYFDAVEKKRFFPHIIEPSGGVDRCLLAFLTDAYHEEQVKEDTRVVLRLNAKLAPVKAAVLPLLKNRGEIVDTAKKLSGELKKKMNAVYDDTANIGKLYRRQDEVGTLFCVTVDMETLEDKQVTVRDRDSMQQVRIPLENVEKYISDKL